MFSCLKTEVYKTHSFNIVEITTCESLIIDLKLAVV